MRESHSSLSTRASVGLSRVVLPQRTIRRASDASCLSANDPGTAADRRTNRLISEQCALLRYKSICSSVSGSTTRERPTDALVDKLEWLSRMPGESPRLSHQGCPTIEPVDLPLPESAQPFRECDKWSGVLPRATRPEMVALPSTR